MHFEQIIQDAIEIYKTNTGKVLKESDAHEIVRGLLTARDTEYLLESSPRHLLQVLFENDSFNNRSYYACDTIQLRNILQNHKIETQSRIVLFNNFVVQRVIKDQKVQIILNADPCSFAEDNKYNFHMAGGVAIIDTNILDIKDKIQAIVINSNDSNIISIVDRIVQECKINCEVYANAIIPGVDKYKFASKIKRYKINLPNLNIHNEVSRAFNSLEALDNILAMKWHWHPDKHLYKRKPERYTAEFWQHSGFFDSIVKEASASYKLASQNNNIDAISTDIKLSPQEKIIFDTLLDINKTYDLGLTFRVAGGWVRDKILGKPSDDIDIAIDKMTGQSFVKIAAEYKNKNKDAPIDIDSAYVVKQNVEKSKHLETTALDIAGLKIDFVNLRSETYGDSRVPQMKLSDDPAIDAQRRDLTINSLFYNVNSNKVEDFVGGIDDLKNMNLKTPLDAKKTFMDDPLRMLRVLRFNSKYPNSKIDQSIIDAMRSPEVQEAYRNKVAPERAGKEIVKLFEGQNVTNALRVLFQTKLDKAVFSVPETENLLPIEMDQRTSHHQHNLLEHTLRVVDNLNKLMQNKNVNKNDRANMLMAALFHDYGKSHPEIGKKKQDSEEYSYVGHEDESAKIADAILKKIGLGENDRKFISLVIREHMRPHTQSWSDKAIGKFMRDTQIAGNPRKDIWELVMMHAQADSLASRDENQPDYDLKQKHVEQMREYLTKPIPTKPLIDGGEIQKLFPTISPKPKDNLPSFIKHIQNLLLDEQATGKIATKEDAQAYIESIRGDIEAMYSKNIQAFNLFRMQKEADVGAGSTHGTGGRMASEGTHADWHNVKRMIYRNTGDSSMISVGDKYRSKAQGAAFNPKKSQIFVVRSKKDGYVVLQDGNGKKITVEIGIELPAKYVKV